MSPSQILKEEIAVEVEKSKFFRKAIFLHHYYIVYMKNTEDKQILLHNIPFYYIISNNLRSANKFIKHLRINKK